MLDFNISLRPSAIVFLEAKPFTSAVNVAERNLRGNNFFSIDEWNSDLKLINMPNRDGFERIDSESNEELKILVFSNGRIHSNVAISSVLEERNVPF